MESWVAGFEGDADVERHAGIGDAAAFRPKLRLTVASDYICPWCYVGFTRIERLREEFDIELTLRAYDLRPGIPPEGISRAEASKGRTYPPGYLEHLRQTALEAGIDMKRPALIPNTRLAHEATEFAVEHGKAWEIHRALFRAYFEDELNIGDIGVIGEVCASIGLDAGRVCEALEAGTYTEEVERQREWCRAVGVTGVPTVVFEERFALVGAQDYEAVRDIAGRVLTRAVGEG